MAKCLVAAGGTGGHIFPALAVARCLREEGVDVSWVGSRGRLEEKLVPAEFPIDYLDIAALRGKGVLSLLTAPWRIAKAIWQSIQLIRHHQPECVLVMGGYVCGPIGVAAWLMRVPIVLHEQNAAAGFTNRQLLRFARTALQAFPGSFGRKSCDLPVVGNPVREVFWHLANPYDRIDLQRPALRVLVIGGSQGARFLNQQVADLLALVAESVPVTCWHQSGEADFDSVKKAYEAADVDVKVTPFIDEVSEAYAWADVVLCRAGALSVSEIAVVGIPAILVPLPIAVDDHQRLNAMMLVNAGAAKVVLQADWQREEVASWLVAWQDDRRILLEM